MYTILFGGRSFEHEISIVSAIALKKVLSHTPLTFVFLNNEGQFFGISGEQMTAKFFSSGIYKKEAIPLTLQRHGFYQKSFWGHKLFPTSTVINLVHGAEGEDGTLASLLTFFDIPFIGPRTEASVVSINKLLTKGYAKEHGVNTLAYQTIDANNRQACTFGFPVIVKPLRLGSSIGVSIVKESQDWDYALDVAFEYDSTVLVEPFIANVKEYNLAGARIANNNWEFSIIEEPQKTEFLDFDKKYCDFNRTDNAQSATLSPAIEDKLKKAFMALYAPLFAGSLIRCDFFVINDEVYLNEINPIPGSLANYLFSDFATVLSKIGQKLPQVKRPHIDYRYIHSIHSAKGKAR